MNDPKPPQNETILTKLVETVRTGPGYRTILESAVRRIGSDEIKKGKGFKETVKAVRSKLHQVGGAYMDHPLDYERLSAELRSLPADLSDTKLREFCRRVMNVHASTRERLPIMENFFSKTLESITPVRSVLDLACGLNPFALPWMPLNGDAPYYACDIYTDMLGFIDRYLAHLSHSGRAVPCDLVEFLPDLPQVHLAFLLKSLPCLEQLDKNIGKRLLQAIPADYILVSFPGRSLGGHSKGMVNNYDRHFHDLVKESGWQIMRYEFPNELAFLIDHKRKQDEMD